MKKQQIICKIIIYLCLFIGCPKIFSQTSKDSITQKVADTTVFKKPEKLKFGCGFGINFVGGTNINVSPNLTYIISDKIEVGGGLQGSYAAIKNLQNTTTFGANVLGRYNPVKKLTTLLEFSELRVITKIDTPTEKSTDSYWDSALFAGAGYNITSKISVGAKYNFLYKEGRSVYTSPVIPFVNISF
ncbi:outer membrane beta-barrel protein [Flavobacterium glaciei]|uniref:Outer membrane protein beta-barrel domain-containing protein n=1 Tax=Flavobacterium glaciei TaxID=386300 RepID=A0A562PHP7_9FLAO|nr:hypothetical protein [Flavobacterium glaciei]RDI51329.1 hypothetical protein DFR66_11461 [Flavobacterium glaciei]TWI43947.1 hypothetical protein IQ02_02773 [Flavobacterium glaciei]